MTWLSSIHTHTHWCDGKSSVEALCQSAAEKGFVSLGVGGHAPLPFESDCNMDLADIPAFREEVFAARDKWQGNLEVYIGLEVDWIKGLCGPADGTLLRRDWDYLLGSVHYLAPAGQKPFAVDGPIAEFEEALEKTYGGDIRALVLDYWDSVCQMIEVGGFDLVGHLDLIKKHNAGGRFFDPTAPWYREAAHRAVEALVKKRLICEVNTGGLARNRCTELYPSPELIDAVRDAGGTISIQSDAHAPEQLDGYYREGRDFLLERGWKEHVVFSAGPVAGQGTWNLVALD